MSLDSVDMVKVLSTGSNVSSSLISSLVMTMLRVIPCTFLGPV